MHLPDGFVDVPTALGTGAVSLGVVAYCARRTARQAGERTVPLLGVTAAFIFAAQMLNFPVGAGTSGHLLGAVLAVALLGPWAAALVMAVVVIVQALVMGDGGLTALGANVFNMGIVGVFLGGGLFYLLKRLLPASTSGYFLALAVGSWASVVLGAGAVALQLAASGTVPLAVALPTMTSVHMIIGLGEALITVTIVAAVLAARPDLVRSCPDPLKRRLASTGAAGLRLSRAGRVWSFAVAGLVVALALAVFVAPFASSAPDGLERVALDKGFEHAEAPLWTLSPLGDYSFPGVGEGMLSTALAGLVGTALLLALVLLLGRALAGRERAGQGPPTPGSRGGEQAAAEPPG